MKNWKKFNEHYGSPVEPDRCEFYLFIDDGENEPYLWGNGAIGVYLDDLDDRDNDNLCDVNNVEFTNKFNNESENMFLSVDKNMTIEKVREFLLSIGMKETRELMI